MHTTVIQKKSLLTSNRKEPNMPTLVEQLNQLAQHEQQTEKLANAIKEFVLHDRIFDMLRKALSNKFTANIPYQHFDNEGFIKLKPTETSQFSGYNAYSFTINVEQQKTALETQIMFDGKQVSILMIKYDDTILTIESVINLLKQVIGVENKIK